MQLLSEADPLMDNTTLVNEQLFVNGLYIPLSDNHLWIKNWFRVLGANNSTRMSINKYTSYVTMNFFPYIINDNNKFTKRVLAYYDMQDPFVIDNINLWYLLTKYQAYLHTHTKCSENDLEIPILVPIDKNWYHCTFGNEVYITDDKLQHVHHADDTKLAEKILIMKNDVKPDNIYYITYCGNKYATWPFLKLLFDDINIQHVLKQHTAMYMGKVSVYDIVPQDINFITDVFEYNSYEQAVKSLEVIKSLQLLEDIKEEKE